MIEIRIHGRGGQGGVTLAKILATSRFLEGLSVQAFGLYAAERSGAPVQAFCRWSAEPITNRNLVYEPDHVIVLDPTLAGPSVAEGLAPGGWILLNTAHPPGDFAEGLPMQRLATVDATAIARRHRLGTRGVPIVNTALAGAAARMLGFERSSIRAALEHLGLAGANLLAADEAWEALRVHEPAAPVAEAERPRKAAPAAPAPVPGPISGRGGDLPKIRTGQWASEQPRRQQMVPPCNHVCPAGNDVQGFLQALARDETDRALEILLRTSPLPAVCGRVCPAPCMDSCNRIGLDGAVNVRQLERFAGDHGTAAVESRARRRERVAVVGSGPAGLTAAFHLAREGYRVGLYEAGAELGGLLRGGIPEYRLPESVLDREIDRVLELGVEPYTRCRIDKLGVLGLAGRHDAVFLATGLQEMLGLQLGTGDAEGVEQGIEFLERAHHRQVRVDGETVLVVGGGNTAVDSARTALRLGAERVTILYRRTLAEMPAIREEIDQGLDEGIEILFLTQPQSLRRDPVGDGGRPRWLLACRSMELGEADLSGRRRPVEIPGSDFELPCHRVILAVGQSADLSIFPEGTEVREGESLLGLLQTPVFAAGDLANADGTVAAAIGSGRRVAMHVHRTLAGEDEVEAGPHRPGGIDLWRDEVVTPEAMKLHLFERQAPARGDERMPWQRSWNFDEVHQGLADPSEARRCLSCGVCNDCDRCVTWCPDGVLKRVGGELVFDYAFCKGCGVCAAECPRNAIYMSRLA